MGFTNEAEAVRSITRDTRLFVTDILQELLAEGKSVYVEAYTELLSEVEIPERSLSDPFLYLELFTSKIEQYPFISVEGSTMSVSGPTVDLFDWSGMPPIYLAVVGLVGIYYELPETLFSDLLNRGTLPREVTAIIEEFMLDTSEVIGTNLFLVPEKEALLINTQLSSDNKLVIFPFSDNSGIDIFTEGNTRLKSIINSDKVTGLLKSKLERYST